MKLRVGCKRKMHRDRPFRYPRALPSLDSASFRRDSEEGNGCGCSRMLRQLEIFVSWSRVEFVMRCSTDFFFFFFSFSKFHVSWHSRCELFLIGLDRFGTLEIREEMEKLEWDQKMKDSRILALNRIAEIFNETSDLIILFQEQNIYHIYKTRRWRYIERINELIESKFVTIIYNCISEYISTTRDKRKEKMWFIKCILLSFNSIKNRTNHKSISIIINKIGISNIVGCKILMDQR